MNHKRGLSSITLVLVLFGSLLLTSCDDKNKAGHSQSAPTVGVYTVQTEPLAISNELPGRTVAYRIAEVRPQVNGIILKRIFTEGSDVKQNDPLYQIDPSTYQASYDQAKAQLAQYQAQAKISELTLQRYKPLLKTKYISQQDYDQAAANAKQAEAQVTSAQANLENARINLEYTTIKAPISGTIGKSSVTEGALVTNAQANPLAVIQQLDPIYVDLTQSSTDFLKLKKEIADGIIKQTNNEASVTLKLEDGTTYPIKGKLEFSEVQVDQTTGSITMRAIFPNPKHILLPGMFVRATLDEGVKQNAILVPQQGVTRDARGQAHVLVVDANNKIESRSIQTGEAIGDKWMVMEGLKPGDKVIVSGLMQFGLAPGVTVTPEEHVSTTTVTPQSQ